MDKIIGGIRDGISGNEEVFPKNIGLYFGSFNPIHVGHLILSNHFVNEGYCDEVWLVVTPQNPLKKKNNLLDEGHRMAMVRIALEDNAKLRASDIEFNLPRPSYTSYTLAALKEKYPDNSFSLIMGEDNLRTFRKWKNYEYIMDNHKILVYPRVLRVQEKENDSIDNSLVEHKNIQLIDAPLMKVSSSLIRKNIKEGKDVRYLLTEPVFKYLDEMNFYR